MVAIASLEATKEPVKAIISFKWKKSVESKTLKKWNFIYFDWLHIAEEKMGQRHKLRIAFSLKMNGEQSVFSRAKDGCTAIHHPEQFYKEQIVNITEVRNDKDEDDFEKIKQLQEQKV